MPDGRSTLKHSQLEILELLYKYRFSSRKLLLESLGETAGTDYNLYKKLEVLIKHELVAKRIEPRLKLLGVPAAYYLTTKGIRTLKQLPGHDNITDTVIKSSYVNKTVKNTFVNHTLATHKYTNLLTRRYSSIKVFTKRDLARFSYFPKQLPDAVLSLPTDDQKQPLRFFFDIIASGTPRKAIDGRLMSYCSFFERGGWDVTNSPNPAVLLVASNVRVERQLQYMARARLSRYPEIDLRIYTSTVQALSNMDDEALVWTRVSDTDEPKELTALLD